MKNQIVQAMSLIGLVLFSSGCRIGDQELRIMNNFFVLCEVLFRNLLLGFILGLVVLLIVSVLVDLTNGIKSAFRRLTSR